MNNSIVAQQNNQEWLTSKEAAAYLGISTTSYGQLIRRYFDNLKQYIEYRRGRGGKAGIQTYLTKEGLLILANIKDRDRGNQHKEVLRTPSLVNAKQQVAEKAIAATKEPSLSELMQAVISLTREVKKLKMPQPQIAAPIQQQIDQALDASIENLAKKPITTEQREILSDMCRQIAFLTLGVRFGEDYDKQAYNTVIIQIRTKLNKYIGRKSIDSYTHFDYVKAYKALDKKSKSLTSGAF